MAHITSSTPIPISLGPPLSSISEEDCQRSLNPPDSELSDICMKHSALKIITNSCDFISSKLLKKTPAKDIAVISWLQNVADGLVIMNKWLDYRCYFTLRLHGVPEQNIPAISREELPSVSLRLSGLRKAYEQTEEEILDAIDNLCCVTVDNKWRPAEKEYEYLKPSEVLRQHHILIGTREGYLQEVLGLWVSLQGLSSGSVEYQRAAIGLYDVQEKFKTMPGYLKTSDTSNPISNYFENLRMSGKRQDGTESAVDESNSNKNEEDSRLSRYVQQGVFADDGDVERGSDINYRHFARSSAASLDPSESRYHQQETSAGPCEQSQIHAIVKSPSPDYVSADEFMDSAASDDEDDDSGGGVQV